MKALLLSVKAGQGHNQCAMAVTEALKDKGFECRTLDTLEYINSFLGMTVDKGYLISTKQFKSAYARFYRLAEKRDPDAMHPFAYVSNNILAIKLKRYIAEYDPDVIVCTHIFAAQAIAQIKGLRAKTVGVVTDFTIHPFWEDANLDYYVTAAKQLDYQMIRKGQPLNKILPIGIPIQSKFGKDIDKTEARRILGMDEKITVLVMSGSMGYGKISKTIIKLDKLDIDFQIISICGSNKRSKKSIDRIKTNKKVYNYGYVDNVEMFMSAADCIITKPGGLTTSEALAKGLPMIVLGAIPGQEERNLEFLLNNGAAMSASKTFPVDECLFHLLIEPRRLEIMKQSARLLGKPDSAKNLAAILYHEVTNGGNNEAY
ncbi:MAG: glycosyltransferase [Eubacteriales bacterium]|nr:glycosyltransferase [Eubacteriales bacterium]